MSSSHEERLRRNSESKDWAKRDHHSWEVDEHEILLSWNGGETELMDISVLLERTIEACRERFYKAKRGEVRVFGEETKTTEYRGWTEDMGDGW